ncbi:MAG: hypothetical protein ACRCTJ_04695 [Brevinema sp.]
MPIPSHVLINLGIFFVCFMFIATILSFGAARGFKFHSCKGDDDNCCKRGHNEIQKKILALIEKDNQNQSKEI